MNVLIVDDEFPALLAIKYMVDWSELEVDNVYTAMNVQGAKQIFARHPVDFLLCDIEMPQENGLELLAWVKDHYPDTLPALLTNHAEFSYAQQAVGLGSIDYLLKPISPAQLHQLIQRVGELSRQRRRSREFANMGESLLANRQKLFESFWTELIHGGIPSRRNSVQRAAQQWGIELPKKVIPVMICVSHWNEELSSEDQRLMEYALCNSAEDMILETRGTALHLRQSKLLALRYEEESGIRAADMESLCETYIQITGKYFSCEVVCYLGGPCSCEELAGTVHRLEKLEEETLTPSRRILVLDQPGKCVEMVIPNMENWRFLLMDDQGDAVANQVEEYLDQYVNQNMDTAQLYRFQQAFLQMLYGVMEQKNISAHLLLGDKKTMEMFHRSQRSVKELCNWVRHIVDKSTRYVAEVRETESIVERIKKYVALHIDQEISREDIANAVFLNKDYMARIFKQETGISIAAYVQQEKLQLASVLIAKTTTSISGIASQVGYSSFSHFSRVFRQFTGVTPMEYRKQHWSDTEEKREKS